MVAAAAVAVAAIAAVTADAIGGGGAVIIVVVAIIVFRMHEYISDVWSIVELMMHNHCTVFYGIGARFQMEFTFLDAVTSV